MTDQPPSPKPPRPPGPPTRAEREAEALRENLRRRKQQARARAKQDEGLRPLDPHQRRSL
jgi:hypothetical protein